MKQYHIEADVRLNPKQLSSLIDLLSESADRLEVSAVDPKPDRKSGGGEHRLSGRLKPVRYFPSDKLRLVSEPAKEIGRRWEVWKALENAHGKKVFQKGPQGALLKKGGFISPSSALTWLIDEGYIEVVEPK